jgi:hypothetical protein
MNKFKIASPVEENMNSDQGAMSVGLDFYGLQEHLILCRSQGSFSANLGFAFDRVRRFVFARVVTTATGVLFVLGVGYLLV